MQRWEISRSRRSRSRGAPTAAEHAASDTLARVRWRSGCARLIGRTYSLSLGYSSTIAGQQNSGHEGNFSCLPARFTVGRRFALVTS